MRITLYENDSITAEARRLSKQIETRKFNGVFPTLLLNKINFPEKQKNFLENEIQPILPKTFREYIHMGDCAADNVFYLEALGLESNTKEFIVILDFSERLDYILHRLCGCKMENVRRMPNYSRISSDILNLNFDNLTDVCFGDFYGVDSSLDMLLDRYVSETPDDCYGAESIAEYIVSNFINDILCELSQVKDYCVVALGKEQPKNSFVYKSKNFSSALATSHHKIAEELEIISQGCEPCTISVRSYGRFEYVLEEAM